MTHKEWKDYTRHRDETKRREREGKRMKEKERERKRKRKRRKRKRKKKTFVFNNSLLFVRTVCTYHFVDRYPSLLHIDLRSHILKFLYLKLCHHPTYH